MSVAADAEAFAAIVAGAEAPLEHHEYTLAIDPAVLAQQLQYLETLQHRENEPLLQGVIDFMTVLANQGFLRYGLAAPNAAELLASLAESQLEPDDLDDAVHAAASLQATNANNAGVSAQVGLLIERFGLEEARKLIMGLTSSQSDNDDGEIAVHDESHSFPAGT